MKLFAVLNNSNGWFFVDYYLPIGFFAPGTKQLCFWSLLMYLPIYISISCFWNLWKEETLESLLFWGQNLPGRKVSTKAKIKEHLKILTWAKRPRNFKEHKRRFDKMSGIWMRCNPVQISPELSSVAELGLYPQSDIPHEGQLHQHQSNGSHICPACGG